jgi:UDP-N-acetylglucosamine:LPS N-acetylglucosamine transferase
VPDRLKVCVVSSVGGHLREILQLTEQLAPYDCFAILNDTSPVPLPWRSYRIAHAERDLRVLWNFAELLPIFLRERPDVVLSAGAGPMVPAAILGKALGMRIIFIETFGAVERPTLTGRILYRLADHFLYQWEPLKTYYKRGTYVGGIF